MSIDQASRGFSKSGSLKNYIAGLRHDLFYAFLHRKISHLEDLGSRNLGCNWTVCTRDLGSGARIYSAGVGRDISFEHALADRFGAKIVLLDPSPTALETMKDASNQRAEFDFEPVALAGHTGLLDLAPPPDPEEGSWVSPASPQALGAAVPEGGIRVACSTLDDLMKKRGHSEIDLLKIDIEGAEYGVLDAVLQASTPIRQIAVEFHNGVLPGIKRSSTISSLLRLYRAGYRLIHKGGSNHTLMRAELI